MQINMQKKTGKREQAKENRLEERILMSGNRVLQAKNIGGSS